MEIENIVANTVLIKAKEGLLLHFFCSYYKCVTFVF
jgi:hypothetical protein